VPEEADKLQRSTRIPFDRVRGFSEIDQRKIQRHVLEASIRDKKAENG
tara:strand:+ start:1582 stop:1725 length:144 start_codon:yes stop_codon:yes gene_type:complete